VRHRAGRDGPIAVALAREGVDLVINARSEATLAALADDIKREMGVSVTAVVADITTEEGRRAVLAAAPATRHSHQQCRRPTAGRFP